ncbi:hypothetical protein ZIOFF_065428 [Zingiber officinale]|uniref:Uncharacterized protein n=1 Tax=Zingiber officinale TaxID=94328 RepID=A0A8J5KH32_ZINOF|nr:hypothetical protein ZIOFF_065428 [Zingiber officinale]
MATAYLLSSPSLSLGPLPLLKRALPLPASSPILPLVSSSVASSSSSSRRVSSTSASTSSSAISRARSSSRRGAVGGGSQPTLDDSTAVYQGSYGPWSVEPSDVREVILYRSGLVTAAISFVLAASSAFIPEGNVVGDIIRQDRDFLYTIGAGGLGLSLLLIHIYVTPIKRFLQLLWMLGVCGSLGAYLTAAKPLNESLIDYVINNPTAVWFVGPLFAALTGLVFKEGHVCTMQVGMWSLLWEVGSWHPDFHHPRTPPWTSVCNASLDRCSSKATANTQTGLLDDGAKLGLLGVWMALFVVFAARKFQQPIKDDIGDKSVFMFNALPEEERKALLEKLEQQLE